MKTESHSLSVQLSAARQEVKRDRERLASLDPDSSQAQELQAKVLTHRCSYCSKLNCSIMTTCLIENRSRSVSRRLEF